MTVFVCVCLCVLVYAANCMYRLTNNSAAWNEWTSNCLAVGSSPLCGLDAVLIRAWCTRQYQSIGAV